MKILLSLLLASIATIAIAEPKQLVCEVTAEAEEKRLREVAKLYRDRSDILSSFENAAESAARFDAAADRCSSAAFGLQVLIVFDTEGLNNPTFARVEVTKKSCGGGNTDVIKGNIEATPSVITFIFIEEEEEEEEEGRSDTFNVDRKTLKAGYSEQRNYSCLLQDIDTSENLL